MRRFLAFFLGLLLAMTGAFVGVVAPAAADDEPTEVSSPQAEPSPEPTTAAPERKPYSHFQVVPRCLPEGGVKVVVKLWTGPHGAGTVDLTVDIDGEKVWEVTLGPGKETSKAFTFPEDDGVKTIVIRSDGKVVGTEEVDTDCLEPSPSPTPTPTPSETPTPTPSETPTPTPSETPSETPTPTPTPSETPTPTPSETPTPTPTPTPTETPTPTPTPTPGVPRAAMTAVCVPEGGTRVVLTLANEAEPGQLAAVFRVLLNGADTTIGDQTSWSLEAGEERELTLNLAEDSGTYQIEVRAGDVTVASRDVSTDCLYANPQVTTEVVCYEAQVTFTNEVPDGQPGEDAVFKVTVDGAAPTDVTVAPNQTETIPYTFDADTGIHTIVVTDENGNPLATVQVETECAQIDKTADPAEGTGVQAPEPITYSVKITNSSTTLRAGPGDVVDKLPVGVRVVADSISDAGIFDEAAGTITWPGISLEPGASRTFTFRVIVTAGFGTPQLDNESTWLGMSDHTIHPVKAIDANVETLCQVDIPLYRVTVRSQNLGELNEEGQPHTVTVEWFQADDNGRPIIRNGAGVPAFDPETGEPYVDTYPLVNGSLDTGPLLWKGAELDEDGNPIDWPGYDLIDGVWVEVEDGGVRPASILKVTVNPTAFDTAVYPPVTPTCNANPTNVPPGETPPGETPPTTPPGELPKTGGDIQPQVLLALMMLISGAALKGATLLARR